MILKFISFVFFTIFFVGLAQKSPVYACGDCQYTVRQNCGESWDSCASRPCTVSHTQCGGTTRCWSSGGCNWDTFMCHVYGECCWDGGWSDCEFCWDVCDQHGCEGGMVWRCEEVCGNNCGGNQTCVNGACRDNGPRPACPGGCGGGQTCIIDPYGGGHCEVTQASSCESCAGGGTLYCTPNCSSGSQCWCTGNPSPACSGGNTSGCGSVDCPGSLGGYWTCNQGRCEAVCQQPSGSGGCTPGAATCTTCAGGRQQCDNGCSTYQQDCVSCVATRPQKPLAISPSGTTTAINVAFKYKSFANLAEWGAFCPINTNSYTYYMDEESSPTLSTQRGTPYVSNPPYQNNYCGGTFPCDIVSPMFAVLYGRSYKWKVTACNGAGSCTDSDIMHFTVRDAPGWWQTVGGGDVYGLDVQSEIGEKASPALIILN